VIPWLPAEPVFPPLESALSATDGANGLLAAGGDLSPQRLLAAYRRGIFPWYGNEDPLLWWSPDPRMMLLPDRLKVSRSLAKTLRKPDYEVRLDTHFAAVIRACAATPRDGQNGTWIAPEMQGAYIELHRLGHAHSVETWRDGKLIGGLYGVAIGQVFYGESMFSHATDASKIALAHLCAFLRRENFGIIDCQMETSHLSSLGAQAISRADFVAALARWCDTPMDIARPANLPGCWPADGIDGFYRRLPTKVHT